MSVRSKETAIKYLKSQKYATDNLKEIIEQEKIDCDFKKVPSYVFSNTNKETGPLKKEIEFLKENNIERCYYGHLHGGAINGAINEVYDGVKFQLVSADFLQFCPLFINKW